MQTLFIGFVEDTADPVFQGTAIRIGYMFSEHLRIAGNVSTYYVFEQNMRNLSFEQKIKFIDNREKDQPGHEPFYETYKDFKKLFKGGKVNDKEGIVLKKKIEKNVNDMFNALLNEIMAIIKIAGLTDLSPIENSSSYGEYFVSYRNPEKETDGLNKLSEILKLNLDDDDNKRHYTFLLTGLFFSAGFNAADNEIPSINEFSEKGFLQELFTFPNYNSFSVSDLNTIRFELNERIENFQQAVSSFAQLQANPAKAFNYLQSDVVTAANTLAAGIDKSALVVNYKNLTRTATGFGKLYLGMIPQAMVFKYFKFIKASQEETMAALQQFPDDESHQFVPVLIADVCEQPAVDEATGIIEAPSMPLRKTLSID